MDCLAKEKFLDENIVAVTATPMSFISITTPILALAVMEGAIESRG